jgi:LacI family gluconate utilization system Gnt-I transcriptional repressor
MEAPRSPRLEDVAAAAGVSTATVSRFLNSPERVALTTREKIRAAVEATGYLPNLTAGALAGNRSRLIAALVPDIAQSIFQRYRGSDDQRAGDRWEQRRAGPDWAG